MLPCLRGFKPNRQQQTDIGFLNACGVGFAAVIGFIQSGTDSSGTTYPKPVHLGAAQICSAYFSEQMLSVEEERSSHTKLKIAQRYCCYLECGCQQ